MKFPFFKQPKLESTKGATLVVGAPRVTPPVGTPRLSVSPRSSAPTAPPPPAPAPRTAAPIQPAGTHDTFPFALASVFSQLPEALRTASPRLAAITVDIPINLILSQLPTGKVSIRLSDLLLVIPSEHLPNPLPQLPAQQNLALPLPQVIASIPPKFLAIKHESTIDINTAELESLPALFDETYQPVISKPEPPEPSPAPIAPAPAYKPVPVSTAKPAPAPAKTEDTGKKINIRLSSVLAGMPDNFLACPRAELTGKAGLDKPVGVPLKLLLSQLKSARIRLPLASVLDSIPATLLANPLPPTTGVMVAIPLMEIIPQIPPHLFSAEAPKESIEVNDADIPMPFQEKNPQPAPVAPEPEPEPVAPMPAPVVSESALDDESFQIFAERKPASLPAPVAKAEPVVEKPIVVPEPAAVAPVPVPEPVAAAPVPAPEPIVEPVPVVESTPVVPEVPPAPAAEPEAAVDVEEFIAPTPEPITAQSDTPYLVNLNRCTVEDLVVIEGVGPALAKRIIAYRDKNGPFKSMEDLRAVQGVGRKTFRALAGAKPRSLNKLLGVQHENELSLQEIVKLTGALPGVEGCLLAMADGVFLTGEMPAHLEQNTVSAFAPQLFRKVGRYTRELKVGQVQRMTIFTDQQPMSIFEAGDVYLIIVHDKRRFSKALLRQLERVSQEIARLCRQRATV